MNQSKFLKKAEERLKRAKIYVLDKMPTEIKLSLSNAQLRRLEYELATFAVEEMILDCRTDCERLEYLFRYKKHYDKDLKE